MVSWKLPRLLRRRCSQLRVRAAMPRTREPARLSAVHDGVTGVVPDPPAVPLGGDGGGGVGAGGSTMVSRGGGVGAGGCGAGG
jgi:hypothetical protein